MAKNLTEPGIKAVKVDPARRQEIPDAGVPGLYFVVQPSGKRSWAYRYRFGGKTRKLTLGRYPETLLVEARKKARAAFRDLDHGTDPGAVKVEARKAAATDRNKFSAVVDLFIKRHASRNRRADDVEAMFRREVIDLWGDRQFDQITKRDVIEVLDNIVDRGSPITANRLRAHLSKLFNWATSRDIPHAHPMEGVKNPAPETPRERALTDDEIRIFWKGCDSIGEPFGSLFKLLLLTGQRRGEVGGMTDRELDGDVWTIPATRAKNGLRHAVPLSEAAQSILSGIPRIKGDAGYIFTTTGRSAVSGFTRAKERLDNAIAEIAEAEGLDPIPPFTLHDLRRTAATGMAGLRFPPHVVEAVLNHKSGARRGVAGVYNRFDYAEEKREALEVWSRRVLALVEGEPDNVVAMEAAR